MIEIARLLQNKKNENYKFTKMVNDRPMYQSLNGLYAIWFLPCAMCTPDWMLGLSTNLDAGKITTGSAASNRDTRCPDFGDASTEVWEAKWSSNTNITVTCIGKTIFK